MPEKFYAGTIQGIKQKLFKACGFVNLYSVQQSFPDITTALDFKLCRVKLVTANSKLDAMLMGKQANYLLLCFGPFTLSLLKFDF